jgi:hypothetical protein
MSGGGAGSAALRVRLLERQLRTGGACTWRAVGINAGRHWLYSAARPAISTGPVRCNTTAAAGSNVNADVTLYTARSTFPAFNVGSTAATQNRELAAAIGL